MKTLKSLLFAILFSATVAFAQVPVNTAVQIAKAEDERRYDQVLENLMKSRNVQVARRAVIAAGRIGDDKAIPAIAGLLAAGSAPELAEAAAFAIGEVESVKGTDAILAVLANAAAPPRVKARAIEAAGKIAAANPKEEASKMLGAAIVDTLEAELKAGSNQNRETIVLGMTALLRARPEGGTVTAAKFLTHTDARVRADAANTLARQSAKNANAQFQTMVRSDPDPIARANAARGLGAAVDKTAFDLLLQTAVNDTDSRVRVSAVAALEFLEDPRAADKLAERGMTLLTAFRQSKYPNPSEKSEMLEIAETLGRLLPLSKHENGLRFVASFLKFDKFSSPETAIALARMTPQGFVEVATEDWEEITAGNWRAASAMYQGLAEIARLKPGPETDEPKLNARLLLVKQIGERANTDVRQRLENDRLAIPNLIGAFAAFKSENTSGILRPWIEMEPDEVIRASLATVLGDQPANSENVEALKAAFTKSFLVDKKSSAATIAIMNALFKVNQKESVGSLLVALNSPNYFVRKRAFELLRTPGLEKESPGIPTMLENAVAKNKDKMLPYSPASGTKLGQLLNKNADYVRALSRKNGKVKAVLTTEKGTFTIDLLPDDAPLTVDNFVKLARSGYFNGLSVHRVVSNFVMQYGDSRGDGSGGPGWSIRCEVNMIPYDRGAVGMALGGKDTGGSQWFVTHSPQPHLDGGYTVFGRVSERDMKVVDNIVRGDKIISVKVVESR